MKDCPCELSVHVIRLLYVLTWAYELRSGPRPDDTLAKFLVSLCDNEDVASKVPDSIRKAVEDTLRGKGVGSADRQS